MSERSSAGAGADDGGAGRAGRVAALSAPFRPRRGRLTAVAVATGQAVVFVSVAVFAPSEGSPGLRTYDRFGLVSISAAIGLLLWRFARLAVLVRGDGLTVRNLSGDRDLAWAQVICVRFGGGQPWVTLDLADGEPLAVMAIQRADGALAQAEAKRLATLVALHSRTDRDD
jgi:Bacterial PH domain